jgi:S1-C subfamily serine protease
MKRTSRSLTLLALSLAAVLPLAAQERQARVWINGQEVRPYDLIAGRKARIGVTLDMRAVANDATGATIAAVTPGGPAAEAGLRSGDVITRFNGRSLVEPTGDRQENESLAALRLIEIVARVEPGDTVAVEYRRGTENRTARIVTARERDLVMDGRFEWPDGPDTDQVRLRGMPRIAMGRGPGEFAFSFGGPLAEIELAPINADLGSYFGTVEGVLVIDAPTGNSFGLKGGDVILSVDGRKVQGPSSLHRILASYNVGDTVKLEIMRTRSRQTFSTKIARRD